jgi:hypothetical protein
MAKQQQVRAKNGRGDELAVDTHESDSPILPAVQLERLHQFRPDLVDFVVDQTKQEAEFRRATTQRRDRFMLTERLFGMVCAVIVCTIGVVGGGYVGLHGQPVLGGTIATAALGTLAVAFIRKT